MSAVKSGGQGKVARPLSPHLQVYAMTVSMMMSILHRITGASLYVGAPLLAAWLIAAAMGPDAYGMVTGLLGTTLGQIVLVGFTWALVHHALGGIRHFIWDFGIGYDLETVDLMAWSTIVVSVLVTAGIWALILFGFGAP
ncbi:MAG: succinate dehydrogenase, cytochrome b556 subunit [Hyphomicrobium sp.]|nr:succinate dehydrogenase, cytochrome b556 subunit [Hyphomicrobium sp.]